MRPLAHLGNSESIVRGSIDGLRARRLGGRAAYFVLSAAASAALLAYMVVAAHRLDRGDFGRFASLFALVVLAGVVFTAVQTHVAGQVAGAAPGSVGAVMRGVTRSVGFATLALSTAWLVGSPLLAAALRTSWSSVAAVGVLFLATFGYAAALGVIQGREQFTTLGALNAGQALCRLVAVAVAPASVDFMLWATAASMLPALIAVAVAVGKPPGDRGPLLLRTAVRGAFPALLVTFVVGYPTVGDVLVGRLVLDPEAAGSFAAVALVGRVGVFFAALVAVLVFPAMVRARGTGVATRSAQTATLAIALLVGTFTVAANVLGEFVLRGLTGAADAQTSGLLLGYTVACLLFALSGPGYFLLLAEQRYRLLPVVTLVPVAVAVGGGLQTHTPSELVAVMLVAGALAAAGGVGSLVASRRRA